MRKMSGYILALSIGVVLAAGVTFVGMKKQNEAAAEAGARCTNPVVRKGRTFEVCVNDMMSFYHLNKSLPQLEVTVSAEEPIRARPITVTELVKDNVFLFIPGNNQELSDDDLLHYELRNLGQRFRIADVEIKENSCNAGHDLVVKGIEYAYIIVTPK